MEDTSTSIGTVAATYRLLAHIHYTRFVFCAADERRYNDTRSIFARYRAINMQRVNVDRFRLPNPAFVQAVPRSITIGDGSRKD